MQRRAEGESAAKRPVVSRRREVGGGSARSLLMTVLGEFVLPMGEPVWTSALVDVLGMLGVEEKSARQALARTAAEGWMSSDRVGRRARWMVTPRGRSLLVEGTERIYGFGSGERSWDGRWLVVLISVPEAMRELRHRLRTQFSWAGFGSPSPGVWISPKLEAEADAKLIVDELELCGQAMSFVAGYGALGSEQSMVNAAWDLGKVEERYKRFIDEFTGRDPRSPDDLLTAQVRLLHEWRRFPFLDPQLPRELLPQRWSGTTATKLFNDRHAEWRERAERRWMQIAHHDD